MDDIGLYDCPLPESLRDKLTMVLFLCLLFYLGFVSRVIFGPLMPAIREELGLANAATGQLFFYMTIGYLAGPPCSGFISSRIYHLGALKCSAWLLGLAMLPLLLAGSFWQIALCMMLIGFAGAMHLPSAIATIMAEIQKSEWGKGMSLHQCAPPLAFFSAPLLAAWFLNYYSWRVILGGWAMLSLTAALAYTFLGRGGEFPGRVIGLSTIRQVAAIPSFWIMVVLLGMGMAGNAGIFSMLPLFFVSERGFALADINTIIGFSQLSGLLAVLFAGIVIDKVGQRLFMAVSLGGAALLTILIGVLQGPMLVVVLFLQPLLLTAFFPAAFGALARVAHPTLRSVSSSVGPPLSFILGAGGAPLAIGYLAENISFGIGIVATGIFMVVGPVLLYWLRLGDYDSAAGC
jgi:NNP family nitrate/nitrite transporter-like MFS transporter